jgi:hypothetical protein
MRSSLIENVENVHHVQFDNVLDIDVLPTCVYRNTNYNLETSWSTIYLLKIFYHQQWPTGYGFCEPTSVAMHNL